MNSHNFTLKHFLPLFVFFTFCISNLFADSFSVHFYNSNNEPLADGTVHYNQSGWQFLGTTDESGVIDADIPGLSGEVEFRITYDSIPYIKEHDITADPVVTFQTVLVTVKLLNSTGDTVLDNDTSIYWTQYTGWRPFGSGIGATSMELLPIQHQFRVCYLGNFNGKSQQIDQDPNVIFSTKKITLMLLNPSGEILESSSAQFLNLDGLIWTQFGNNHTTTSMELLSGTHFFKVGYNGTLSRKIGAITKNDTITFHTYHVSLHYAGSIKYRVGQDWVDFTQPTMELLEGNHRLKFSAPDEPDFYLNKFVVDGSLEKTFLAAKLSDLVGNGIQGGSVSYFKNEWNTLGVTNNDGYAYALKDGDFGNTEFKISYQGNQQSKISDVETTPVVHFNTSTVSVTVKLLDVAGNEINSDNVQYYSSGWKTFGSNQTTTSMELLPGNYNFRIGYKGASNSKTQNIEEDPVVVFYTKVVTVKLLDVAGNEINSSSVKYYASGWKTFGSNQTTTSMELLPGNYNFRIGYKGASNSKTQNISSNSTVVFNTTLATVKLLDVAGNEINSSSVKYYASGWKTFGSNQTTTSMELLPGNYNFRIGYKGASNSKTQNIGNNPTVEFHTTFITMKLLDSNGEYLTSDYAQYYASGWKLFGSGHTTTSFELLPGTYSFKTGLDGNTFSKSQYVSGITEVIFVDLSKGNQKSDGSDDDNSKDLSTDSNFSPLSSVAVYPNPFRDKTNISFELNVDSDVILEIYDMNGKKVISLIDKKLPAGTHQSKWQGASGSGEALESGIYIYRLISGDNIKTGRIILSK